MSNASDLARRSESETVSATIVEMAGGKWNHDLLLYEFHDGSSGYFRGAHHVGPTFRDAASESEATK